MLAFRTTSMDSKNRHERKEALDTSSTYQAHLSFVTHRISITMNEEVLMDMLKPFCKAIGILVKKHVLDEKRKSQSGYGFLFFVSLEDAMQAANALKGACIDDITFDCTLSNRSKLIATRKKSFTVSPPPFLSVPSLDSSLSATGQGSTPKLDMFNSSSESLSSSPSASYDEPGISTSYPCSLPSTSLSHNGFGGYPQLVEYPRMGQIATYALSPDGSMVPIIYSSGFRPNFPANMPASVSYACSLPVASGSYPPHTGEAYYVASLPPSPTAPLTYPSVPYAPPSHYQHYY